MNSVLYTFCQEESIFISSGSFCLLFNCSTNYNSGRSEQNFVRIFSSDVGCMFEPPKPS